MADWDRLFISKIAQGSNVEAMISEGITSDMFDDLDCRAIWELLVDHARRYRQAPSWQAAREEAEKKAPDFRFEVTSDPLEYVLDNFRRKVKRVRGTEILREVARVIDNNDPEDIDRLPEILLAASGEMSRILPETNVGRYSDALDRIKDYHIRQFEGYKPGIPYGIPDIDALTHGIQKHEVVTISGWSGRGKSTLGMYVAWSAYKAGYTPLIFSMEMEKEAILRKFDTQGTNASYTRLKSLTLTDEEMERWEESAKLASLAPNNILTLDDIGKCTVERVYAEIVRWQPDIAIIDYITLMEPSRKVNAHWEGITQITKDLKALARNLQVPIVAIAQTNADDSGSNKGSNIAYSKSIVRDSDVLFELWRDEEMEERDQMEVRLIKNRDGKLGKSTLLWDVDRMKFTPWRPAMQFINREEETAP